MSLLVTFPITGGIAFIDSPPAQAQQVSGWQQFFQRIVSRSPLPRKRGGGRDGNDWVVLSPGNWTTQLWTLQPSFIWRFNRNTKLFPDRIEILQVGATSPIWSQAVQRNSPTTIPITAKLEPGKTYFVRLLRRNVDLKKDEVLTAWEVQVLSIVQRQKITAALDRIDPKLKPLDLLQRRIEVFAKYELWSDAFQEIEQSKLSSTERQTAIDALLTQLTRAEPSGRGR